MTMIKIWIYVVTNRNEENCFVAVNENDTISIPHLENIKTVMHHFLLPAWCVENNYRCRVVVREIEI